MILRVLCSEAMHLESVIKVVQPLVIRGPRNPDISGISFDSRTVEQGHLYVAVPGQCRDGAAYIDDAIERGAVAVVTQDQRVTRSDVSVVHVEDARRALAEISAAFYAYPAEDLRMVGVTGTNGKTTIAHMVRNIINGSHTRCGMIGTVKYEIGSRSIPASRTTPEAPDIHLMLHQMKQAGCSSAVLEVSSHALVQRRTWGIDFDVAVFANLSQDHLDYHGTMEQYFQAKSLLFTGLGQMQKQAAAVINIDDEWGVQLANMPGLNAYMLTYGTHPNAKIRAEDIQLSASGSFFWLHSPWGKKRIHLKLLGGFNVYNALAAVGACGMLDVPFEVITRELEAMTYVPGRLQPVPNAQGVQVFVDYAHTPDALKQTLCTLREFSARRLITVVGCGGDRDKAKRPLMGKAAACYSDQLVLTSDNPRSEDPEQIIRDMLPGIGDSACVRMIPDREEAIKKALELAESGDTVVIAGKGHENYQEFKNTVVPFDDVHVARQYGGE